MAPRLESLEGKVVYLVDTGFHGARDFMEEAEGFNTNENLCKWLADEVRPVKGPLMMPEMINIVVVGGEWNPFWITTDFFHTRPFPLTSGFPRLEFAMTNGPSECPKLLNAKTDPAGFTEEAVR
jgi:hypothetical protein